MTDLDQATASIGQASTPPRATGATLVRPEAELNLLDGAWRQPRGVKGEAQYNPSTGATTGWLTYSSTEDVEDAVASAARAAEKWARFDRIDRLRALAAMARDVEAMADDLAQLIAGEVGKPIADARREVELSIGLIEAITQERRWAALEQRVGDEISRRLPLGIAGGISLYHFPLLSPLWMLMPAMAAGNAYVLRPCTWSPLTSVEVARVVERADLPRGAFNMIQGSLGVVDAMLAHPGLAAISYVGSGPWAHYMYEHGSRHGKRVQALGAIRQVHVVLHGADIQVAAGRIVAAATEYAGQRWLAGTTVIAETRTVDRLIAALSAEAESLEMGAADVPGVALGPVVRPDRRQDLLEVIAAERQDGRLAFERQAPDVDGFFVGPAVSLGPTPDGGRLAWRLWEREVPGPIIGVVSGGTDTAAALIRECAQAVVAVVHGPAAAARSTAERLGAGIVAINRRPADADPRLPSAVWGGTFFGAASWSGADGLLFFSRPQVIEGAA
jgi:malonate-semialdehyde dehydrogenase (acetylating)/methylmalonate-semialdehyde dehydrogenase